MGLPLAAPATPGTASASTRASTARLPARVRLDMVPPPTSMDVWRLQHASRAWRFGVEADNPAPATYCASRGPRRARPRPRAALERRAPSHGRRAADARARAARREVG